MKLIEITEQQARQLTSCPVCTNKKELNTVVCWDCFKNKPKHSNLAIGGYKYFDGTLAEFINMSYIPF